MIHDVYEIAAGEHTATLYTYTLSSTPEIGIEKRPMVIICPGGGYRHTSDREAEPVVMPFLANGIHACILRYSCEPARFPVALTQLAKAVALVREQAEEWTVDPDKIAVMGFSAGGHLAGSMGVFWDRDFLAEATGLACEQYKPNGMILCYAVLSAGEHCHAGSFEKLLGDEAGDPAKRDSVSIEKQVTASAPPAFIWHTYEDASVPVENSLMMMSALRANGVPFEAHIYPKGGHGLSLGTRLTQSAASPGLKTSNPELTGWIDLATSWMNRL